MITLQKDTLDPQADQELRAIAMKSEEAFKKGDAAARAALFTEDAVLVTEHGPVCGRQAIEKHYAELFREWHFIDMVIKLAKNSPHAMGTAGNEAWSNGEWTCSIEGQSGYPIRLNGYWLAVNVREGDTWKIRLYDALVPGRGC
jgi:ketosteroid isomerase-like protein